MSKFDNFIKSFKNTLMKSGDKLVLYKTEYTIISSDDKLTLMKDQRGTPCAYETSKLKEILRSMDIKKATNLAGPERPQPQPSASPTGNQPSASPKGGVDKMHAGKIRVDKVDSKGRKYHYWVDANHGTKHEDHGSEPHSHQIDEASMKLHTQMNSIINMHSHPDDSGKLKKMLTEFVEAKAAAHHLKEAHSQIAPSQGGFHTSTLNNIASKQDVADRKFNQLKTALKESKQKLLNKGAKNE